MSKNQTQARRDFIAVMGETIANECVENRQMLRMLDTTVETQPFGASSLTVPESSRDFCTRRAFRHAFLERELHADLLQARAVPRALQRRRARVDIRDPFNPEGVAFYIPAVTSKTDKRCVGTGANQRCKVAIQTNNVEVDDRGYIYIVDRANTGMHILELTGAARSLARF